MDESEKSGSSQPNVTKCEENKEKEQHLNGDAIAVAVNQEQTADILKLDIDCCEEAFDYLPLEDLVSVGRTCKRMQQVAGYCFQQNYFGYAYIKSGSIKHKDTVDVEHFAPFIQNIELSTETIFNPKISQKYLDAKSKFQRLKQISTYDLKSIDMLGLGKKSMGRLEELHISFCRLSVDFLEIINQCVNLRRLYIIACIDGCNWQRRKYPTLEHVTLLTNSMKCIEGIPMFLQTNPNIRKFATSFLYLLACKSEIMTANIKLDTLVVRFGTTIHVWKEMIDLLNRLHERGFYRKLHFHLDNSFKYQDQINQLATVNGLVKLFEQQDRETPLVYSVLKNLEEINLRYSKCVADLEILSTNLVNLKCLILSKASIDDIMPFIRRSVEMQKIKISYLEDGVHFSIDTNIIDLLALNRERKKLPDAQKITLYIDEKIYLATKWAKKETDLGLIRLKRKELREHNHDFV